VASLQVGGTVGTLALIGWIRRRQFQAVAILFLIAVPVVGSIGYIGLNGSETMLLLASFIAGACVLGVQSGINVCGALVYPTSLRALGSGWELGIGRLGSIVGPLVGALFVRMPVDKLYMWSAAPFLLGAIACFIVHRLNQERVRSRPWLAQAEGAR
jgi:AAHS family 4-hydroxybenzoate transporter-like MFS transporter